MQTRIDGSLETTEFEISELVGQYDVTDHLVAGEIVGYIYKTHEMNGWAASKSLHSYCGADAHWLDIKDASLSVMKHAVRRSLLSKNAKLPKALHDRMLANLERDNESYDQDYD